jgi:ligand-binding sensor domain-containing protein/signal transduction histidine kinase
MSSILMTGRLSDFHLGARDGKLLSFPAPLLPRVRLFQTFAWLLPLLAGPWVRAAAGDPADGPWAGRYTLREWHAQDGLPSEDVTRVLQDRAGYLWMATSRGLARFDGVYFENLSAGLTKIGAPINVRATAETEQLGLIFALSTGGTVAFKDGAFRWLDFARDRQVNSLFAEPNGTLWASCEDRTILRFAGGRTEVLQPNPESTSRLVAHFAIDSRGRVWIAGNKLIARYEAGKLVMFGAEFGDTEYRVATSRQGDPWVLTKEKLWKLDGDRLQLVAALPPLTGSHYVSALLEDRNGTLWLGSRSQGLYAVVDGECRLVPTSGEAVVSLCEDTEGDIWAASNGGGLNRLRFRDFQLYDRSAGLGDNFSYTVSEDEQGTMWLGNRDGGVARVRAGKVDVQASWPGWPQFSVTSVLPDGHGQVWVTSGSGVFKIDPAAGDKLTRVESMPSRPQVRVAHVARNGDYWVALESDRVGRYREGKFVTFGPEEGFDARLVRTIDEDPAGGILFGSTDGRLIRFDGTRFSRIPLPREDQPVQAILPESEGITWVGTSGNGLFVLINGQCRQVTDRNGLLDAVITAIVPDDHGYLWFGSSVGVFSLRRQELLDLLAGKVARVHPVIVGRDDGMHGLSCLGLYKPSAWKSRDGRLWFATRKGVLTFDPGKAIADNASPPAFVAAISCDDERQPVGGPLNISARVRKLELRFSVLCLGTPDRVQLKYRLDGFDSQWITAGPNRTVTYPQLPAGEYRLRAMSSLGNGVWKESDPALVITVVPLWWQTLWFRLVAVTALVALVILVVRTVSHRRLRARLERLEHESAIERERARIARNIHDDLGASLTRISLLTQTARRDNTTPESRQLGQIYETVRQITRSMDEIVWAVNPKNDHLDGLVSYLVSYAQSFLRVAGIRCRLDLPDRLPAADLTSNVRHNLYLCQKEALNNIVKHSGADEVTIAMRVVANSFTFTISDNGRQPPANGKNGNGNGHGDHHELRVMPGQGLANIAQRVTEMDGTCEFVPPTAGEGARLSITILLGTKPGASRLPTALFKRPTP